MINDISDNIDLIPNTEEANRILLLRTEQISKQAAEKTEFEEKNTYVCFKLHNEFYGIPYQNIKEVMSNTPLTRLPGVNNAIAGIINRRGALLAVLNLKKFFNFTNDEYIKPYILVVKIHGITIGILADTIEGSAMYDASALDKPLSFSGEIKPEYIIGLHNSKIAILNTEEILLGLSNLIG